MRIRGLHLVSLGIVDWSKPTPSMQPRPWKIWQLVVGRSYRVVATVATGDYSTEEVQRCRRCGVEPGSELGRGPCHTYIGKGGHSFRHPREFEHGLHRPKRAPRLSVGKVHLL